MDHLVCPSGALALFYYFLWTDGSNFCVHFSGFQPFILQTMSNLRGYSRVKAHPLPVQSNLSEQAAELGQDAYHQSLPSHTVVGALGAAQDSCNLGMV